MNQRKAGALLSYASMGIGYLVSLLYTPIVLRLLGQSEYGLYNLVASVVAYLGLFNFGFGSAYMRYYVRYKVHHETENIHRLNGMFITIFSIMGLIALIAGIAMAFHTSMIFGTKLTAEELGKAKILMIILAINMAISFPTSVLTSHVTANERFIFYNLFQIIRTITNPFFVLPVLLAGYGSIGFALINTLIGFIGNCIYAFYCLYKLKMRFIFSGFDWRLMKEIAIFSSYVFMGMIVDQINWNIDKLILGRYHGTISVAIYGVAAQFNQYFISIATVIPSVFQPRVHQLIAQSKDADEITAFFTRIGRLQFMMIVFVATAFVFYGRQFISLWVGDAYKESYIVAVVLIVSVALQLTQNIGIEILRAKNVHKFRSILYLSIALFNMFITLVLANKYKELGAALATALSLIIGNGIIMNWYYHKKIGINIPYYWRSLSQFIPAMILPVLFGVYTMKYINIMSLSALVLCVFFYVVIYLFAFWMIGMNEYEKTLISAPLKRAYLRLIKRK